MAELFGIEIPFSGSDYDEDNQKQAVQDLEEQQEEETYTNDED